MSLQIRIDIKKLYKELCQECKKKLIKHIKEELAEEEIRKTLEEEK
jgi:tryptophanyl-tRNA synthetase